ncbi:MAG: hypothetical protein GY851_16155 [bacterium]|nr:hypothetical protein [bacterium]
MFPCEILSGHYLEFRGTDNCKLYGRNGEFVRDVAPQGDVPVLTPGENHAEFGCEPSDGPNPRARVTVISRGDLL